MSDLIDRQAAIDAAERESQVDGAYGYMDTKSIVDMLNDLPSAQSERKKGKWYKPTGMMPPEYAGVYRCSECDGLAMRDWKTHKQTLTDFCQNCGADMRGADGDG